MILTLRDLPALKDIPGHERASMHLESRSWASGTDADIKFMSSMKARASRKLTLPEWINWLALDFKAYSIMTFMPSRTRIIQTIHSVKIPLKYWCQLLCTDLEKDFL